MRSCAAPASRSDGGNPNVAEAMASSTADAMIEAIVRAAPRSNEAMLHIGVICQGTREPP